MDKSIIKKIRQPVVVFIQRHILRYLPDSLYLKTLHRCLLGKKLNLKNPVTYNEKLNWLKIHDRNPLYTKLVDKYEVRQFISKTIGTQYLVPLLGVWNNAMIIDFSALPERFVLKCTHDSGSKVICADKKALDLAAVRQKLNKALKEDCYSRFREWSYKNVPPRIIAEQYIEDHASGQLMDYRFFCFNGQEKLIMVEYDRMSGHKRNLYTPDWQYIDASVNYPTDAARLTAPPKTLNLMIRLARVLSKGMPHVRVDFYSVNDQVFFGELTFFHAAGFAKFMPESLNHEMGSWLKLPISSG